MISHGNYRKELFLKVSTGVAFERSLFEAVERCGWKLHALPEVFQTKGAGRALPRGFSFDPRTPGQSDGNEALCGAHRITRARELETPGGSREALLLQAVYLRQGRKEGAD